MRTDEKQFSASHETARKRTPAIRFACATTLLPLVLLLTLPTTVRAQFNYTISDGQVTITGYTGPGGAVNIPPTIGGLPVTKIGSGAFYNKSSIISITIPNSVNNIEGYAFKSCTSLTSVTIPIGVTGIGDFAFQMCTSLTNIAILDSVATIGFMTFSYCENLISATIGNSVATIGGGAFFSCTSLTNITIPSSVTNIGDSPFFDCTSLSAITVDALNSFYSSVDGVLFDKDQTVLIQFPGRKAGSYSVPPTTARIEDSAFYDCAWLTDVTLGESVTNIGNSAFSLCRRLVSVTSPSKVASIGDHAFWICSSLTAAYFKGSAPSTGLDVFYGDANATVYYLPGTTNWGATFGGRPTALWLPQVLTGDDSFGVQTNQFGFNIGWADGMVVAVDACTNLANPVWSPLQTNTLTGDSLYFSDSQWTNHPARFYRLRWP